MRNEEIADMERQITEAAEVGISLVGYDKALRAAVIAQHKMCADLFKLIHGIAKDTDGTAVLPLTSEVMHVFNNAVGSSQLTAEILKRDLGRDMPDDSMPMTGNDKGATRH